jgi:hypothetical protein
MSVSIKLFRLALFAGAATAFIGLASSSPALASGKDEAAGCAGSAACYSVDGAQQRLYRETEAGDDRRGHRGKLTADDLGRFDREAEPGDDRGNHRRGR